MKVGQYCIQAHRGVWRIRQCNSISLTKQGLPCYSFQNVPGETVYSFSDRESALRRSFELNGWKWPPRPRKI